MLYPEIVLGVTAIIGGGISLFVLPKLTDLFSSFQVELPLITRILLAFSNLMKNYGILIFVIIFLLIVIFLWLIKIPKIRFRWHKTILKIPVFGKILKYGQYSQFTRNLGILIASGVPINKGLKITAQTITNDYFKYLLNKISIDVEEGGEMSEAIKEKGKGAFPVLIPRMIAVGEKTGKLDEVLNYLSDFYEEEMDNISKNLSTILEPVMLIIIGLVVAFVALAIISPIYQLTGSIGAK
jgi:type IV pilus assembly protein PilC